MTTFTLATYLIDPGTCAKIGIGKIEFDAPDETAAIARADAIYPADLTDCDYAVILGPDDEPIWERGSQRQSRPSSGIGAG